MSSQHIYPGTTTRLASELNGLVERAKELRYGTPELKAIMDQIASGSDWVSLGEAFGYTIVLTEDQQNPGEFIKSCPNAETAYNLIGSLNTELLAAPFLNQVVSRMG